MIDSSSVGGIEKHIAVLTDSLRHHGIDARIVLLQDHGNNPWIDQLDESGLTARHLDGTRLGLYRALKTERPALVHTHGYKAGILGRLTARLLGIPTVSTFHMGETPRWPVSLYAFLDNYTSILSTRIAVSAKIQSKLPYGAALLPNYVQVPRERPDFPPPPPRIGFIGRLSLEKAPDRFCQLARRIGSETCTWHVYGDGPLRSELAASYSDCVTFHGTVTDMAAVWANLGLAVMPSRAEGLPLASIEALSAGVPLVATDVGDLHKVVVDGVSGWLVPVDDIDALARSVSQWLALDAPVRQDLRATCWQHADAHFSERTGLPPLLKIYSKLGVKPEQSPLRDRITNLDTLATNNTN